MMETTGIFVISTDCNHFQTLLPEEEASSLELIAFMHLHGKPVPKDWKSPKMVYDAKNYRGRVKPKGDFPSCACGMVLTRRALDALSPLIGAYVESCRLDIDEDELYAINVRALQDALNFEASDLTLFSNGRVMWADKFAFDQARMKDFPIFIDINTPCSQIFVTSAFVDCVKENKLLGFLFKPCDLI